MPLFEGLFVATTLLLLLLSPCSSRVLVEACVGVSATFMEDEKRSSSVWVSHDNTSSKDASLVAHFRATLTAAWNDEAVVPSRAPLLLPLLSML